MVSPLLTFLYSANKSTLYNKSKPRNLLQEWKCCFPISVILSYVVKQFVAKFIIALLNTYVLLHPYPSLLYRLVHSDD
jgi:hypothetical protein